MESCLGSGQAEAADCLLIVFVNIINIINTITITVPRQCKQMEPLLSQLRGKWDIYRYRRRLKILDMKCVECGRHISLLLCHLRHNWCTLMQNANNAENTAQNGENLLKLSTTVQNLYNGGGEVCCCCWVVSEWKAQQMWPIGQPQFSSVFVKY